MKEKPPGLSEEARDFRVTARNSEAHRRGERLRAALAEAGGRQEVARQSGVPAGTIAGYEAGGEMKLSNAVALARVLDLRLEWLATGDGPMLPGETPAGAPPGQDMDLESLVAALEIVERLTPDAPVEARAEGALRAHLELRRATTPGHPPAQIIADDFAACLRLAEQLATMAKRPRGSARRRLVLALNFYRTLQEAAAEPESP